MNPRKLTYSTAQKIREIKKNDPSLSASKILKLLNLNCSDSAVQAILSGRTYNTLKAIQKLPTEIKLNPKLVKEIKGKLKLGRRLEFLAIEYNVSYSTIRRIKS